MYLDSKFVRNPLPRSPIVDACEFGKGEEVSNKLVRASLHFCWSGSRRYPVVAVAVVVVVVVERWLVQRRQLKQAPVKTRSTRRKRKAERDYL